MLLLLLPALARCRMLLQLLTACVLQAVMLIDSSGPTGDKRPVGCWAARGKHLLLASLHNA